MKYISAEEFLKQPKKVQEVFIDWWQPSIGDLYCIKQRINLFDDTTQQILQTVSFNYDEASKNLMLVFNFIAPLFTEGQLRKFIEDKTNRIVELYLNVYKQYNFMLVSRNSEEFILYESRKEDLLQAYWKVACEIAKEELN